MSLADWHVALAYAAGGDDVALQKWIQAVEELARAGRYPSGSTVPAVARALGLSIPAVKVRVHRARIKLRQRCGQKGEGTRTSPAT